MTASDISTIEACLKAATPGHWSCWNAYDHSDGQVGFDRLGTEAATVLRVTQGSFDVHMRKADAEFIARAPADVAALIAEVRRLQSELDIEKGRVEGLRESLNARIKTTERACATCGGSGTERFRQDYIPCSACGGRGH